MSRWIFLTLIVLTLLILCYMGLGISSYRVVENSMSPGLYEGDLIIVDKVFWRLERMHTNHMMTVEHQGMPVVKRAVLEGGQTIAIDENYGININGTYVPLNPQANWSIKDGLLYIPKNDYFFLGDNLGHSLDSRHYGLVHRSNVIGKVLGVIRSGKQ